MVNRRVKCKYRCEVSHKKSCSGVNTVTRFAKKSKCTCMLKLSQRLG